MVFVGLCLPYSTYIILLRSIYVVTVPKLHSFFITEQYPVVYTYYIFYIYSSMIDNTEYFHILATVNNVAMRKGVHISFQVTVSVFFGQILRSRVAKSYDIYIFNFLKKLHNIFHSA